MLRNIILFSTASLLTGAIGAATLNYEGSSTVGKFMIDASEANNGFTVRLNTKTESSGGEKCAAAGKCDMGGVARDVNQPFLDRGVVKTLIGKDAIAVIVHADNPVSGLTSAHLKGIFSGSIKNWSEVGGPDKPISALIVKKGSATRKVFREVVMNGADYSGARVVTPDAKIVTSVARDPGAIGQISFAFIGGRNDVKALSVDGQAANVSNSSYPITRPLYITTKGAPAGPVREFISWALSGAGQSVVKQRFVGAN